MSPQIEENNKVFPMPTKSGPATPNAVASGGDDGQIPTMSERMARLEGAMEGLKRVQDITVLAVVGVGAILIAVILGFGIYGLQRADQLGDRVSDLPGKISSDFRDITKTLAESITATKQQAPQVIIMPAPSVPAPQSPAK